MKNEFKNNFIKNKKNKKKNKKFHVALLLCVRSSFFS